jgi:hypothetical protein
VAALHLSSSQTFVPTIPTSRRKVEKGTLIDPNFVQLREESAQKLFAEAGPDSASKFKLLSFGKADQQRTEYLREPSGSVYPPMMNSCSSAA